MGSGDLPAHTVPSGRGYHGCMLGRVLGCGFRWSPCTHCAQWEGLQWVHVRESAGVWVQVVSLHTPCPVGGATMGACEGECWGVGSGGLPAHTVPSGRVYHGRGYHGCI